MSGPRRRDGALWVVAFTLICSLCAVATPVDAARTRSLPIPRCTSSSAVVCVTNSSANSPTLVKRGQRVEVTLRGAHLTWSIVREQGAVLLRRIGTPVRDAGASRTTFFALYDGRTTLEATATPICSTATVCSQFVLLWRAALVIVN